MQHMLDARGRQAGRPRRPRNCSISSSHGIADVLLAVVEDSLLAVLAPTTFADVLGHRPLVDLLPTFDPVGAAGVGKALAFAFARVVRIVRRQDVAGREIGGVQVEDVFRELPAQRHETGQLGPRAIGDEERVVADVEGRLGPNSPRHSRMVRTCWRFSSST